MESGYHKYKQSISISIGKCKKFHSHAFAYVIPVHTLFSYFILPMLMFMLVLKFLSKCELALKLHYIKLFSSRYESIVYCLSAPIHSKINASRFG